MKTGGLFLVNLYITHVIFINSIELCATTHKYMHNKLQKALRARLLV